ncbi:hypothetical protein [Brachybacterium sp. AOP3-A1-3]|uniref:hypothetical protein n=1 Tax=Brachybacterium sp. AOP3-A1-3 TaxID=3457699 RepID=UPI004033BF1B
MKLYRPVLIETAEQAEVLPDDAIVISVETGERYTRGFEGDWWGVTEMGTRLAVDLYAGDVVTALVPIEAEEEVRVTPEALAEAAQQTLARANRAAATGILPPDRLTIQQQTRYVTPWRAQD